MSHLKTDIVIAMTEIMVQVKLPARTPSAFQLARRTALYSTVLLGHAAIFGHEENNGL